MFAPSIVSISRPQPDRASSEIFEHTTRTTRQFFDDLDRIVCFVFVLVFPFPFPFPVAAPQRLVMHDATLRAVMAITQYAVAARQRTPQSRERMRDRFGVPPERSLPRSLDATHAMQRRLPPLLS